MPKAQEGGGGGVGGVGGGLGGHERRIIPPLVRGGGLGASPRKFLNFERFYVRF